MRRLRFGSRALDELRYEASLLAKDFPQWVKEVPFFDIDHYGYERQVLSDLQLGLMALCGDRGLELPDRGEALMNVRGD